MWSNSFRTSIVGKRRNEKKLRSIAEIIIFCGKQNIVLRAHQNKNWIPGSTKPEVNPGNFLALLNFRDSSGDESVRRDFHTQDRGVGKRKITYLSLTMQNDSIACCGQFISESILRELRKAPSFSAMAVEAADSSNKEQMPVVVRFVDNFSVREEFLGFIECDTGLTGMALHVSENHYSCSRLGP